MSPLEVARETAFGAAAAEESLFLLLYLLSLRRALGDESARADAAETRAI